MAEFMLEPAENPKTEWVDDEICYRINRKVPERERKIPPRMEVAPASAGTSRTPYVEHEDLIRCDELNDFDVEVTDNGRFRTYICIPPIFFAYIIGTKGFRRKRLEEETKTTITIPRENNNNKITITGASEKSVVDARQRLEFMDISLRDKHQITHFISYPLINEEIKSNFLKFKEAILSEGHIDGMEESIFVDKNKIHLTIGVMVLLDNSEKEFASKVLDSLRTDIVIPKLRSCAPLVIKMKGLDYMNDDPSHVDVLYAKVSVTNNKNPDILQDLSDAINEYFCEKGIVKSEKDYVKLHATLINTRKRKGQDDSGSGNRNRRPKRIAFDARSILSKFENFEFGEQVLESIHISDRSATDETGFYKAVHKISCICDQ